MAVETNVNTSMPDEHPSKCPKLQSEEIDRDPGTRKQICEFPINKQDEIRQAYLINGLKNYIWYISVTTRSPQYVFLATPLLVLFIYMHIYIFPV